MKVVAAILIYNKKILAFKRPASKTNEHISLKYEFPGGKIKKNETEVAALKRELQEELDLKICNFKKYFNTSYDYIEYTVHISFYVAKLKDLNFILKVHNNYKVLSIEKLKSLDWLKANYSVINHLQNYGLPKLTKCF